MEHPALPPLYYASVANDLAEVRRLLEAGADPNDGESIYHAAEKNHRAVLDLLKAHGGDFSGRHTVWNNTPVFFLCGHTNDEEGEAAWSKGVAYLLEQGADPNVTSYDIAATPLHQLATAPGTTATARLLLDHGADPRAMSAHGQTPYVIAVRNGNAETARLIAERGGASPLTAEDEFLGACMAGDEPRARDLMTREPALRDRLSQEEATFAGTPLHWAAWRGFPAAVRALIALGAPIDMRDREFGSSPLGWAGHGSSNCRRADDDYVAVVDLLRQAGATREASINSGGEAPERMATPRVAERFTTAL